MKTVIGGISESAARCQISAMNGFGTTANIELSTRRVHIAGISARANGLWMKQIARNVNDAEPQLSGSVKTRSPQIRDVTGEPQKPGR
jgi:hypothetical protein